MVARASDSMANSTANFIAVGLGAADSQVVAVDG
jgi:hypothetical protein